ncbi:pantetheine-phosphate adenylyltransferase [Flavobacteriaceae bacterium]|jgi:pantetheine-phosphate adenylyltransferase|nr:pantetheine-phosphate adenylyltransferase [Flavobacteriaceae bacterium]MBT4960280.1 pantetheine-phosphate adenylyltransferase [Flavobacteriaceae bacterium]MBT5232301.1 pantetheine-phosphate adenylyltransferase [Flavobacteriaceae bacterium]MBT6653839.1 pantetheine-phosphate adenylyltransferase [Flavobacteriaceae bacterium]MBT7573716.1 pantetheine-phosphate adenylyltransferase [Flavobacteriaceae bacterium]|tara:strand:- start:3660 stop:4115 length:456 start_codon:yes stop_codon:yes gene_type:complete
MKKAIFPGSFDPFTLGHLDILKRSLLLFDEIIVGVGKNINKKTMFSEKQRVSFIKDCFKNESRIKVESYDGLTIDFCKKNDANFIVRGIRNNGDFEFEKAIARTNRKLSKIETVFLLTSAKTSFISSGIVRELITNNGDYKLLVPKSVKID